MLRDAPRIVVDEETGCWLWQMALNDQGYGHVRIDNRDYKVHALMHLLWHGPIGVKQDRDHLCHNRACCNPAHLEVVTHAENVRRGNGGAMQRGRTHCPKGHPYDDENTLRTRTGGRACRKCHSERSRVRYHRLRQASRAETSGGE